MTVISPEELLKIYKRLPSPDTTITFKKDTPTIFVMSAEPKPIKLVFEGDSHDHFTEDVFDKLVKKVAAADCGEKEYTMDKITNNGFSALADALSAFSYTVNNSDTTPRIISYTYDKPVTKIFWTDGTMTKVSCNPDEADQFSGFLAAIAKKMYPKYLEEYEKYTVTIPKQIAEEEAKKAEEQRRAEKRRAKREAYKEKRRKIKAAKALAEQYQRELELREIEKIASEKFGVPKSYFGDND